MYVYLRLQDVFTRMDIHYSSWRNGVDISIKSWTNPTGERNLEYDEGLYRAYLAEKEGVERRKKALVKRRGDAIRSFAYGKVYCYHVATARYWEEGRVPKDVTPDFKVIARGPREGHTNEGMIEITVTAVAEGNRLQFGEESLTAPEDGYLDAVRCEIKSEIGVDRKIIVYLKHKEDTYTRVRFLSMFYPYTGTSLSIETWTNMAGERYFEYDDERYRQYLERQEKKGK